MSMSRSVIQELCDFVLQKPSAVLGPKFFDCRLATQAEVAYKTDKLEQRVLCISKFRVFLLVGKTPSSLKIDRAFHLLAIKAIQIVKADEINLTVDDAGHKRKYTIRTSSLTSVELTRHLLTALKHYFPDIGVQLKTLIELTPTSLYADFGQLRVAAAPRACHSFRRTYAALCDFYGEPYREEVSWDVEKIYTINKATELRIEDFSHLLPKDLIPITGVLQYSTYFTGLIVDTHKIPPELIDVILSVIRKSHNLRKLQLRNCALPRDFITLLASSLHNSNHVCLEILDLSKNVLDDKKGFTLLSGILPKITTLKHLNFSECGMSEKCSQLLCGGIYNGLTTSKANSTHGLVSLNLACNQMKDDISSLVNLVSLCTSLRELDLTDTGFPLEKLWAALKYGGLQIERLLLAGCQAGKKPAESALAVKEYFSMAVNLTYISFANTPLQPELLKNMLLGLATNQQLKPYHLDLSSSCEKGSASVLETCLSGIRCESISLRDNNLEADMQTVVNALSLIGCLRRVDIGGSNLTALRSSKKPSHVNAINKVLLDIVKLYAEDSPLEELILSDARLGSYLSILINTLGSASNLRLLDVSANDMGNFGARILSKALQLNVSLRTLIIDNNHIGGEGFADLAASMSMNKTMTSIPYPVHDVYECMTKPDRRTALNALTTIENALEKNRTADSVETANAKKALSGGLQSLMDHGDSEITVRVDEVLVSSSLDKMPSRIEEMIDDFVDQVRRESTLTIRETLLRIGDGGDGDCGDGGRAEKLAVDRLKELWLRDAKRVISDWRWREICERCETVLRASNVGSGSISSASVEGSPSVASPRVTKRSNDPSHRPRSIIGELGSPSLDDGCGERGITLDTPPKPSALTHLQKARPRAQRRIGTQQTIAEDPMAMSRSTEDDETEIQSTRSEDSVGERKPLSERAGYRPAMLPEASLATVQLRPAAERVASPAPPTTPVTADIPAEPAHSPTHHGGQSLDSPPPLPNRVRGTTPMSPPSLPPKPVPEPRSRATVPTAPEDDDENANSRRSVADMARIFNR